MTFTCPHCKVVTESPRKFCIGCGSPLPVEAILAELGLRLKTGQELRIGESSVFECEVANRSHFSVANLELSLSSSRFARESGCFVDHIKAESVEVLAVEVDVEKPGQAILYVAVKGLIDGKNPVCYRGQTYINAARPEMRRDSDAKKVIVNIGPDALVDLGGINLDSEGRKQEASREPQMEWIEIPLKRDTSAERDWLDQIQAKALCQCPYCSALIDPHCARCDICSATLPSWFAKRRDVLCELEQPLSPPSCVELTIPSLDQRTFHFYTHSKIMWGRHSDNDIHLLFHDANGNLDETKSLAISKFAGEIRIEDGRAMLINHNRFVTHLLTRYTSELIELRQGEKIELKQEGILTLSNLCSLEIRLFTSPRQGSLRMTSPDVQERKRQIFQLSAHSIREDQRTRSSCLVWPDRNVECIRVRRTDVASNVEHILLVNSTAIGSGDGCCVHIPKSGVQHNHAKIINHNGAIWFESSSDAPVRFEMGTMTKYLKEDAIMRVDTDSTVRFGYLETHLKFHTQKKQAE